MNKENKKKTITIVGVYFGPKLGVGVFIEKLLPNLVSLLKNKNYTINFVTNKNVLTNSPEIQSLPIDNIITHPDLESSFPSKIYFLYKFNKNVYVKESDSVLYLADSIIGNGINNATSIVHDINEFDMVNKFGYIRTWFRKTMIRRVIKKARRIVVISGFVHDQLSRHFPIADLKNKVRVIHNGIDVHKRVDIFGTTEVQPYFLIVGRVDPKGKRLYEALKIFEIYQQQYPEYQLKIVGGMNEFCRKDGMEFIEQAEKLNGVKYLGYVEEMELHNLYRQATATIFFSAFEGFGFPILESFLQGCPVITNSENLVNDELAQGYDIKISEAELQHPEIIVSRMNEIKKTDKKKLVEIANQFSWEKTAQKYMETIDNL
ncbi:MAG: glycosyltransferase [Candidatus Azobacteroides sp.]|nr:glycosyltransferase [Candidatus Azobacteroides sp.]